MDPHEDKKGSGRTILIALLLTLFVAPIVRRIPDTYDLESLFWLNIVSAVMFCLNRFAKWNAGTTLYQLGRGIVVGTLLIDAGLIIVLLVGGYRRL